MPEFRTRKKLPRSIYPLQAIQTSEGLMMPKPMNPPKRITKPTVTKITFKRMVDEDPDISYLGRYSNSDSITNDEIVIDLGPNRDPQLYRYFIASNVSNMEEARQNYNTFRQYEAGNIVDYYMYAEAEIEVPDGSGSRIIQTIRSGGIGGIQSNSDPSYFAQTQKEELDDLKTQLSMFGIKSIEGAQIEEEQDQ